jgi:mRNA-degrading endonuclease RelE of RelBE toxin-antitoxin system
MLNILYLPIFAKKLKQYSKKNPNMKKDYQGLLNTLESNPTNAIAIKENVYKIRLQNSSSNRGKSAGYRVYYFYKNEKDTIVLLYIYSKNEQSNLNDESLNKLIKECQTTFENELSE